MRNPSKKMMHRAIDGEVSKTETRILKRTLSADPQARTEFRQLKRVIQATERVRVDVPPGFARKVIEGLKPPPHRP
jgi:anti-sigma factor RsiW